MNKDFVGAEHEFHSKEFVTGWAERFAPTPERVRLFELIHSQLKETVPPGGTVIELGMGPAYLAEYLLDRMESVSYIGIDFSLPMLEIARERLRQHLPQVTYLNADLVDDSWEEGAFAPVDAIVSTWALHDLGSPENIKNVYQRSFDALVKGGFLLNGDFIKPVHAPQEFEGGRFYVSDHLELLAEVGFTNAKCLADFEVEIENPTPAQNYSCLKAVR